MEKMKVEREKGRLIVYEYCRTPRLFIYDHVGWYDGFKFVFGKYKGDVKYRMFEVSTLAEAATPTESEVPALLVHSFFSKLQESRLSIGRVVEKFHNNPRKTHNVPIWLSTLNG